MQTSSKKYLVLPLLILTLGLSACSNSQQEKQISDLEQKLAAAEAKIQVLEEKMTKLDGFINQKDKVNDFFNSLMELPQKAGEAAEQWAKPKEQVPPSAPLAPQSPQNPKAQDPKTEGKITSPTPI